MKLKNVNIYKILLDLQKNKLIISNNTNFKTKQLCTRM